MRIPRSPRRRRFTLAACVASLLATMAMTVQASTAGAAGTVPRLDHVVIVVMENKAYADIIGRPDEAPYINNTLAPQSAVFTDSHAITHPSQPNYLALFSGWRQGVTNDDCPQNFVGVANLGTNLINAGHSFAGYSESLPFEGDTACSAGGDNGYARKHNPWVDFDNVPASSNKPFTEWPSSDNSRLPTVSFVVPNLCNDMHNCSRDTGDAWLRNNIDPYAQWARTHNSLLIVTWDEDDNNASNVIPTLFSGAHVQPAFYSRFLTHYSVLRTIEDMYGLPYLGASTGYTPITEVWN